MDTKFNKLVEGMNRSQMEGQKKYLREAQEFFGRGPTEMAQMLGTNFNTYKAWLYGENPMPGIARVAIDCKMRLKERVSGK